MPFGLRLSLVLLIAGCAESALLVPESDWMIVPAPQRATLDKQYETELAACRAELAAASASLAAIPHAQPAPPRASAAAEPAIPGDDPWLEVERHRAQQRNEARGRVEATTAEVYRADLAWRQLRVETAEARLAMVVSQRELIRAQAINRNLRGEDTYDAAPLRGQFSREQRHWYALATKAATARDAFEHATTDLASYKEAYAQLARALPMRVAEPDITEDHEARLSLTGWSISRSDIRRRRGLGRFLDDAIATPQLRKQTYWLRPLGRTPTAVAAAPAASTAAAPAPTAPAAEAPAPKLAATPSAASPAPAAPPAAVYAHPADRAAAAPAIASKPIAPPPSPAAKAVAPAPPAVAAAKPDAPPSTAPAGKPAAPAVLAVKPATLPPTAPAAKPATPASPAALAAKSAALAATPADRPATPAAGSPQPTAPGGTPASSPATAIAAKPATAPSSAPIVHPADRAAASPTAVSSNARPAPPTSRSRAATPAQVQPTSAAKPVEPDGHMR
jgi:hypothetical protein